MSNVYSIQEKIAQRNKYRQPESGVDGPRSQLLFELAAAFDVAKQFKAGEEIVSRRPELVRALWALAGKLISSEPSAGGEDRLLMDESVSTKVAKVDTVHDKTRIVFDCLWTEEVCETVRVVEAETDDKFMIRQLFGDLPPTTIAQPKAVPPHDAEALRRRANFVVVYGGLMR